MRVIIFSLTMLMSTTINAQEIGLRFGEVTGNNIAIDGVFDFEGSRIHADISIGDGLGIDALYDFLYESLEDEIHWYAGAGVSTFIDDDFFLGISGEIGLEYVFDRTPIVIGIDYRPTLWIVDDTGFKWDSFGVNVRYRF